MKIFIYLLSLFLNLSLSAQNPLSVRSHGVANIAVTFSDINSLFNNPAGLANLEQKGFLLSAEQTFQNPRSDNVGGGFAMPTSFGSFGISSQYSEFDDLRQINFKIAYARKLMEKLYLGAQFDFFNSRILSHEKSNLITFEIGLIAEPIKNLTIGIHLSNPAKLEIIENRNLRRFISAGATYTLREKILFHTEITKDFDLPLIFKSGIECELISNLWFRLGYQPKPMKFSFGLGYKFKFGLRFDLSTYYQKGINYTPHSFIFGKGFVSSFGLGYDFIKR